MGRSCDGGGEKVRPETQLSSQKQQQQVSCAPARAGLCVKHCTLNLRGSPGGGPSCSPHFTDEEKGWTPLRSLPRAVLC